MKDSTTLVPLDSSKSKALLPLTISLNRDTLHQYIHAVNTYPTLSSEQERELLLKFKQTQEWKIAQQLIVSNLKFVVFIAKSFSGYQLNQADLIQEGNIGLIKALKHYDPSFNVRLMAFAIHWIKSEIYEFVLNNWKIVKIANNKHQRKLFFNLRKFFQHNAASTPSLDQIAQELDVPVHEARNMQARLFSGGDLSLESMREDQGSALALGYSQKNQQLALTDKNSDFSQQLASAQEQAALMKQLHVSLQQLDPRGRDILHSRWLKEPRETLQEIAKRYNISFERVRQLEKKAFQEFQRSMLQKKLLPVQ